MSAVQKDETEKKRGNPNWGKGMESPFPQGRPKVLNKDKKTNKSVRHESLLQLVRKFRPHLTKAIQAAVDILDNKEASESGKLRASALIIQTYRELVKDVYDYRYDDDEAEEIQQNNAPVFSLKMISADTDNN